MTTDGADDTITPADTQRYKTRTNIWTPRAPLKRAIIDDEEILRLKYWEGNDALKGKEVELAAEATSPLVTILTERLDFTQGAVAEGTLRLCDAREGRPVGLYLYVDNRGFAVLVNSTGRTEMGPMGLLGDSWEAQQRVDRQRRFGKTARFRLLARRGMLEFYLDDHLMQCYTMGCHEAEGVRIGVVGDPGNYAVTDLKVWQMSLPGLQRPLPVVRASASSIYGDGYAAALAFDGKPHTRWCSGRPYGKGEWLQAEFGAERAIEKIVIHWETAYAAQYELLVSSEGKQWKTIHRTDQGQDGTEVVRGLSARARYLRLNCLKRGTEHGFSVWELQAFEKGSNR